MKDTSVRFSYIGARGTNLEQRWRWNDGESVYNYQQRTGEIAPSNEDLRRKNPSWTGGCCSAPILHNGYQNSHSLQAEVERRYSNGLAFQFFYAFSRVLTTNDTGGFSFGSSNINATGGTAIAVPETWRIMGNPT
jgi:hypothetical protein